MNTAVMNFARICKGGNVNTIENLLGFQSDSVIKELEEHFGTSNKKELAIKLSIGI